MAGRSSCGCCCQNPILTLKELMNIVVSATRKYTPSGPSGQGSKAKPRADLYVPPEMRKGEQAIEALILVVFAIYNTLEEPIRWSGLSKSLNPADQDKANAFAQHLAKESNGTMQDRYNHTFSIDKGENHKLVEKKIKQGGFLEVEDCNPTRGVYNNPAALGNSTSSFGRKTAKPRPVFPLHCSSYVGYGLAVASHGGEGPNKLRDDLRDLHFRIRDYEGPGEAPFSIDTIFTKDFRAREESYIVLELVRFDMEAPMREYEGTVDDKSAIVLVERLRKIQESNLDEYRERRGISVATEQFIKSQFQVAMEARMVGGNNAPSDESRWGTQGEGRSSRQVMRPQSSDETLRKTGPLASNQKGPFTPSPSNSLPSSPSSSSQNGAAHSPNPHTNMQPPLRHHSLARPPINNTPNHQPSRPYRDQSLPNGRSSNVFSNSPTPPTGPKDSSKITNTTRGPRNSSQWSSNRGYGTGAADSRTFSGGFGEMAKSRQTHLHVGHINTSGSHRYGSGTYAANMVEQVNIHETVRAQAQSVAPGSGKRGTDKAFGQYGDSDIVNTRKAARTSQR